MHGHFVFFPLQLETKKTQPVILMYRNYSLDRRKVFTNLKSLDLKLCNHVLPPTSDGGFLMMMKGVLGSNGDIHVTH